MVSPTILAYTYLHAIFKLNFSLTIDPPILQQTVHDITKLIIFAYEGLEHGVLLEVEVFSNMSSYFGSLPPALMEHIKKSPWCPALMGLDQSFDKNTPRKTFSFWRGIEELKHGDKEVFGLILNLAPGLRATAEKLLNYPWFSSA